MRPILFLPLFLSAATLAHSAAIKPTHPSDTPASVPAPITSSGKTAPLPVIRVNSMNQPHDFLRPWAKKNPFPRRGTGAILANHGVLVTAELIADNTYVELEKPGTADKCPAKIVAVDYDANLALLEPTDPEFLGDQKGFALDSGAGVGDAAEVLQVENNGDIARTPATLTTISVGGYPMESIALLTFRLSTPLQSRDSSFVLPAVREGRLLGMLMRYDARSQTADVVPAPVISTFLARAERSPYQGFPRIGLSFASTRDPQFRRYIGLTNRSGGVYVTDVAHDSPAAQAGMQRGDIVLSVNGHPIDQDGLYEDEAFGKIAFTHLITTTSPDTASIPFTILRDGKEKNVEIAARPPDPSKIVSLPYQFDTAPRYVIAGGLIFQELSRAYLRAWGNDWRKNAPERLVYLDAFQSELPAERGKIVFLSGILPSPDTLGYENLEGLVITRVNGKEIRSLDDLAQALTTPINGFHKIEFEEDPGTIHLDAASINANAEALARHYGIPSMMRL